MIQSGDMSQSIDKIYAQHVSMINESSVTDKSDSNKKHDHDHDHDHKPKDKKEMWLFT